MIYVHYDGFRLLARFPQLIDILISTFIFEAMMRTVPVMTSTLKCMPNFKTSSLHVIQFHVCMYLSTKYVKPVDMQYVNPVFPLNACFSCKHTFKGFRCQKML